MNVDILRAMSFASKGRTKWDSLALYFLFAEILKRSTIACPRCQTPAEKGHLHRRARKSVATWQCSCGAFYTLWTGTIFQGVHRRPIELMYIVWVSMRKTWNTSEIARDLKCDRKQLTKLIAKIKTELNRPENWAHRYLLEKEPYRELIEDFMAICLKKP